MATADIVPAFVLVKSTNPYNDGRFGVAAGKPGEALRFTRQYRCLEVGATDDLEANVISKETYALLEAESFLAVKPATQSDIDAFNASQAATDDDKDAEITRLKTAQAELEGRLMRLEQAAKPADTAKPPKIEKTGDAKS
jgi:hypothetical protein